MAEHWKDKLHGGRADGRKPSDFDPASLKAAIKDEMEHTDDPHVAAEIAMDHLEEDPAYYEKLKKIEPENEMKIPSLAEVYGVSPAAKPLREGESNHGQGPSLTEVYHHVGASLSEAPWGQQDLDLGDKPSRKPGMSYADQAKARGQASSEKGRLARRQKKATAAGHKDPKQMILPGLEDAYKQYRSTYSHQKTAEFPKQEDGRAPLDQVKGKIMHISQGNPEAINLMYHGHTYETLPKRTMGKIDSNSGSEWGSGAFKIEDDGKFTQVSADWDSSG